MLLIRIARTVVTWLTALAGCSCSSLEAVLAGVTGEAVSFLLARELVAAGGVGIVVGLVEVGSNRALDGQVCASWAVRALWTLVAGRVGHAASDPALGRILIRAAAERNIGDGG